MPSFCISAKLCRCRSWERSQVLSRLFAGLKLVVVKSFTGASNILTYLIFPNSASAAQTSLNNLSLKFLCHIKLLSRRKDENRLFYSKERFHNWLHKPSLLQAGTAASRSPPGPSCMQSLWPGRWSVSWLPFFPFSLPPCRVFSFQAEQTPQPRGCSAEGRLMPTEGRALSPLPAAARFWSTSHWGGTAASPGHGDALLRCTWATLLSSW